MIKIEEFSLAKKVPEMASKLVKYRDDSVLVMSNLLLFVQATIFSLKSVHKLTVNGVSCL